MTETGAENCSQNAFCASLDPAVRAQLCMGCSQRVLKAGSAISYSEMADRATLVLEGLMVNKTESGDPADKRPCMYTFTSPGRLLYQDTLLNIKREYEVGYITAECLTDCRLATFKYRHVQNLYNQHPDFARKTHESIIAISYDFAKYIGILRAPSARAKVYGAIELMCQWNIRLTTNGLAELLALDRTTVSRELTALRKYTPELWEKYTNCSGRLRANP